MSGQGKLLGIGIVGTIIAALCCFTPAPAKADVFGYSTGAAVGLQLAIRHPDKVNKLVVLPW